MEDRYRRLAGATARNIAAYNETRADPERPDAVHRHRHRRAGRPDDARGQQGRGPDRQARPEGARGGHPPRPRHAAPVGQRRHRPHQGQRPEPDRVRDGLADRLADGPRRARRRGPHRPRRHALPAGRTCRGRCACRACSSPTPRSHAVVEPLDATRSTDPHYDHRRSPRTTRTATAVSSTGLRRRGRGSTAAGRRRGHPGVRRASARRCSRRSSRSAIARAARIMDELERAASSGRVRRLERPAGAPAATAGTGRPTGDGAATTRTRRRTPTTGRDQTRAGDRPSATERPRADRRCDRPIDDAAARRAELTDRAGRRRRARALPERLYAARERKGVDLYRAERDTKIRARYLAALERGDYKRAARRRLHEGLPAQLRALPRPRPRRVLEPVAPRARRADATRRSRPSRVPRPLAGATPGPDVLAGHHRRCALMTVGVLAFGGVPRRPAPALREAADDRRHRPAGRGRSTSTRPRPRTRFAASTLPGATVDDRDRRTATPYSVTADSTGAWSGRRSTCGAAGTSSTSARLDPETGKHSEDAGPALHHGARSSPSRRRRSPSTSRRTGRPSRTARSRSRARPRTRHRSSISAAYTRPGRRRDGDRQGDARAAAGPGARDRRRSPTTGAFSAPYELTAGRWAITVTASSPEGKTTTLTRNVTVAYKGVNVVVAIKGGRAWLKVWVDGKVDERPGAAGRVYAAGQDPDVHGQGVGRGPHRQRPAPRTSRSTAPTSGACPDVGNPETWLFAPPDDPVRTDRR